jgi:site-specific DNA-cytosine methylase
LNSIEFTTWTVSFVNFSDVKIGTITTAHIPKCIESADKHQKAQPIYEVKDGQITIKGKQYPIKLADGYYIIRRLTVNECKRLQTVPDWYDFSVISNSQAYKCLGNGWTCDVITHLIKSALNQKTSQA